VTRSLDIIHKELDLTMALCGHRHIGNVTKDILTPDCPFFV
jgi:L-lactate dehydrogenase (cytochrome)